MPPTASAPVVQPRLKQILAAAAIGVAAALLVLHWTAPDVRGGFRCVI
jgi:hypothetical protein